MRERVGGRETSQGGVPTGRSCEVAGQSPSHFLPKVGQSSKVQEQKGVKYYPRSEHI